ncbi:ABHD8-like protein [Mya arenaria]|uniref:acylglycerol lipase n=1 Tax=Mya arenaria TaxID=6604 RepID=A0ABY7DU31_MYAAR|nr:uncharacterized protein LOC128228204 [Mya arenaria]WAR00156.1 ABHD8-like protein [Mya arenaria]
MSDHSKEHTSGRTARSARRIAPIPDSIKEIVQVRPNRYLHIRHVNKKQRDEKFEREMQSYLLHKESALLTAPMSFNKKNNTPGKTLNKNSSGSRDNQSSTPPNLINHDEGNLNSSGNSNTLNNISTTNLDVQNLDNAYTGVSSGVGLHVQSPSRLSSKSASTESISNVQIEIRPNSLVKRLDEITEKPDEESHEVLPYKSQSPRKTKGHRPVSARSIRQRTTSVGAKETQQITNYMPNLNDFNIDHKDSPFKDVTLFFFHGVGGCADIWNSQIDFFGHLGIEIIAPDLVGHGLSPAADNAKAYHFKEILADLEAVFDKYCKRENIVIGHSYGCAFAAALGRRRARRVSKLVLVSGGAPIPLAPQPGVFSLPVCMLSCIRPCLFSRFEKHAFHDPSTTNDGSRQVAFDVPARVLSHTMQGQDWLDGDALYHQWLAMPTLLLHGKHDSFVSLEEQEEMEETVTMSQLEVIENASHMVMMEAPLEVNSLLYVFIFQASHDPHDPETARSRPHSSKSSKSARLKHHSKQLA